jgi:antitoxin component of MazEF toxin-antitoxin module
MIKRLTRQGNSVALVLDKPIVEAAGLDDGQEVEVSTDGDVIVITPVRSKSRQAKLRAIVGRVHAKYAGAFRRLAE